MHRHSFTIPAGYTLASPADWRAVGLRAPADIAHWRIHAGHLVAPAGDPLSPGLVVLRHGSTIVERWEKPIHLGAHSPRHGLANQAQEHTHTETPLRHSARSTTGRRSSSSSSTSGTSRVSPARTAPHRDHAHQASSRQAGVSTANPLPHAKGSQGSTQGSTQIHLVQAALVGRGLDTANASRHAHRRSQAIQASEHALPHAGPGGAHLQLPANVTHAGRASAPADHAHAGILPRLEAHFTAFDATAQATLATGVAVMLAIILVLAAALWRGRRRRLVGAESGSSPEPFTAELSRRVAADRGLLTAAGTGLYDRDRPELVEPDPYEESAEALAPPSEPAAPDASDAMAEVLEFYLETQHAT